MVRKALRMLVVERKRLLTSVALGSSALCLLGQDSGLNRRIENQIRSNLRLVNDVEITIGQRKTSDISGFDDLDVTLNRGLQSQSLHFLLSRDDKTLAKMERIDLSFDVMSKIDVTGRPYQGGKDAKVIIVNYDDFECPFCSKMHQTLSRDISKYYGNRVKIIYKDFPLMQIHHGAMRAAVDGNCLATQSMDAYWAFADYAHTRYQDISGTNRRSASEQVGSRVETVSARIDNAAIEIGEEHEIDILRLRDCVAAQRSDEVRASIKEAEGLGVRSAPTLLVNGEWVEGAEPQEELRLVIDRALVAAGEKPPQQTSAQPNLNPSKLNSANLAGSQKEEE